MGWVRDTGWTMEGVADRGAVVIDAMLWDSPAALEAGPKAMYEFVRVLSHAASQQTGGRLIKKLFFEQSAAQSLLDADLIVDDDPGGWSYGLGPALAGRISVSSKRSGSGRVAVPVATRAAIFARDLCCQACSSEERLTLDHIVPVSRGGGNEPENLQVLCQSCNSAKGAREPAEIPEQFRNEWTGDDR